MSLYADLMKREVDAEFGGLLYRTLEVELRAKHEDDRTAEFVATTENPVEMGFGAPEVIRVKGMSLKRFKRNPVVLNAHNRRSIHDVVGKALSITKDGRQIIVKIQFTEATESGRIAWSLVQDGSLRAVSIGYRVLDAVFLGEGEEDGKDEMLVKGPAFVAKKSELLEVSVVPVPADPMALKRAYEGARLKKESKGVDEDDKNKPTTDPAPQAKAQPLEIDSAELLEARKREILSICPSDLREFAEGIFLKDPTLTLDAARKLLLEERDLRLKPVGTPEPPKPKPDDSEGKTKQRDADPADDKKNTKVESGFLVRAIQEV